MRKAGTNASQNINCPFFQTPPRVIRDTEAEFRNRSRSPLAY